MRSKGLQYEEMALDYLTKSGLKLIAQNFNCKLGEIDLVMRDCETLVFIEVRYRESMIFGSALESITKNKQEKIVKAAKVFLNKRKLWNSNCRFDVVAISGRSSIITRPSIEWLKDAFEI